MISCKHRKRSSPTTPIWLALWLTLFAVRVSAQFDFHQTDALFDRFEKDLSSDLIALVYKSGNIIYQKQSGLYVNDRQLPIYTSGKWLTAALVMTFLDEKKLALDDSIGKYLPVFSSYGKGSITIKQCLDETTGFEPDPSAISVNQIRETNKRERMSTLEEETKDMAANRKIVAAPGAEMQISSAGVIIAAHIVEVVGSQNFEQLFQARLAIPLAMTSATFSLDKGPANPATGAFCSPNDLLHFLIMMLNKGVYHGKRILSAASVQAMGKPLVDPASMKNVPRAYEGLHYGLSAWTQNMDTQGQATVLLSPGSSGCWPLVDYCHQYACVIIVKSSLSEKQRDIMRQIKSSIDGQLPSTCH